MEKVMNIIRLACYSGVHPFSSDLKVTPCKSIFYLILQSLSIFGSGLFVKSRTDLDLMVLFNILQITLTSLSGLIACLVCIKYRRKINSFYTYLKEVDNVFEINNIQVKNQFPLYYAGVFIMLIGASDVFSTPLKEFLTNGWFSYYWSLNANYIIHYEFTSMIYILKNRISGLREMLKTGEHSHILSLYSKLLLTCYKINKIYGKSILCTATVSFFTGVFHSYMASGYALKSMESETDKRPVYYFMCAFLHFYNVWSISSVCHCIKKEAQAFNQDMYTITLNRPKGMGDPEAKVKLHLAAAENYEFTACDFFSLDYTFFQMVIGSTCTYVVILIQVNSTSRDKP